MCACVASHARRQITHVMLIVQCVMYVIEIRNMVTHSSKCEAFSIANNDDIIRMVLDLGLDESQQVFLVHAR